MSSVLKNIYVHNGMNLEDFQPEVSTNFHVLLHMTIGPSDQSGGHDYSLGVCTPRWLDHAIQHEGKVWGRHLLIVNEFDAKRIMDAIAETISNSEGDNWESTSLVLSRFFFWEYEDYQYSRSE